MKKVLCFIMLWPAVVDAASCPAGYLSIDVPDVFVADACPFDAVVLGDAESCSGASLSSACWIVEQIRALCGAGITKIKTSNGLSVSLYSDKVTTPSLNVQYNGMVCYADMKQGNASGTINVKIGDVVYHLVEN